MVPFGLKIVWFSLSLSGLLGSWAALPAFIRTARSSWLPVVYSIANTILQGMFCLGLIWRLEPSRIPHAFAEAQTALIHASWTCIAGVCLLGSSATASLPHKGLSWLNSLQCRYDTAMRIIFLGFLPVVVIATQLAIIKGLNVTLAGDGMFCDAFNPVWVRLVGYSGLVPFLAIPSLVISVTTSIRIIGFRRNNPGPDDNFTPLPISHRFRQSSCPNTPETRHSSPEHRRTPTAPTPTDNDCSLRSLTPSFYAIPSRPHTPSFALTYNPPGRARITVSGYKYHLPSYYLSPASPSSDAASQTSQARRPSTDLMTESGTSTRSNSHLSSVSPIAFAPSSETGSIKAPSKNLTRGTSPAMPLPGDMEKGSLRQTTTLNAVFSFDGSFHTDSDDAVSGSIKWARMSMESSGRKSEMEFARITDEMDDLSYPRNSPMNYPTPTPHHGYDDPSSRHMLIFFHLLRTSSPIAFGTQHVALILTAWAPCVAFGIPLPRRRTIRS
ncbi:unnamed protein product [Somion occarium]|uniref:Pheromone receptor n=1 Tax=Somion occarium TaxID=3059160 RepID=A0ABP1DMS9_9APHY